MDRATGRILGIEGGGTKASWMLFTAQGDKLQLLEEGRLAPTNFRLTSRERILEIWREMPRAVDRVGVFLAGCATTADRASLTKLCAEVWPQAAIVTGSDRESGFASAFGDGDGITVNAGTGSSITGRRQGQVDYAGGWGHILGDAGGGYDLSLETLRFVLRDYDLHRRSSDLAQEVLRALALNDLNELVRWAQTAGKMEIATLAPVVFAAGVAGHEQVNDILRSGARVLAEFTGAVADRLEFCAPPVALLGGLFHGHSIYVEAFRWWLAEILPAASVFVAEKPSTLGAAWLALGQTPEIVPLPEKPPPEIALSATEQINERSLALEKLSPRKFVDLFVNEEEFVQEALHAAATALAEGVALVAAALKNNGRLFYVGAGTSGRLGVLDAIEIPPTFGAAPDLVQGIIAGGAEALHRSVEGAEDNATAGALAIVERGVTARDVVCGISASGRAPFVLGALRRGRDCGARTLLLTCNPARESSPNEFDLRIDLPTGPELLAGSTRLKAGTATKVALNILSTGAMVQLGHVHGNLMIDLAATNDKLRDRAVRLLMRIKDCDYETARTQLAQHAWKVRAALAADDL
jgi:N-acetylmuramic acid 6-phosphate etherase